MGTLILGPFEYFSENGHSQKISFLNEVVISTPLQSSYQRADPSQIRGQRIREYGQYTGDMHPTGMHTCWLIVRGRSLGYIMGQFNSQYNQAGTEGCQKLSTTHLTLSGIWWAVKCSLPRCPKSCRFSVNLFGNLQKGVKICRLDAQLSLWVGQ